MSDLAALRAELESLRLDCAALANKVDRLVTLVDSADFELVTTESSGNTDRDPASSGAPSGGPASQYSTLEREEAARATGAFFVRCLAGRPRGDSGRSRIQLQARIYVVVRCFSGQVHSDPVLVFERYSQVKRQVCGPSDNFGDSVFAGFASKWEARVACEAAGLGWPASR